MAAAAQATGAVHAAMQHNTSTLQSRAKQRSLVLPDEPGTERRPPVTFNGYEYVLTERHGAKGCEPRFTYNSGEAMVGQTELPCAHNTKLVGGRHRFINAPDNTKPGYLWRPGHRYTNRNIKVDEIKDGEAILKGSRYVPYLRDTFATSFDKGALMWSGARFDGVASQKLGHVEYEAMCANLAECGDWQAAKPVRDGERPGCAAYTRRFGAPPRAQELAQVPEGSVAVKEADGGTTLVPETQTVAPEFGNAMLVPGKRGAIPNGPAAFSVHHTPTQDLRWLTRVAAQRTSGNVPTHGPADVPYFEQRGFAHSTGMLLAPPLDTKA